MDILYKGRCRGKTTELIKKADNHNGYIVCINVQEAGRVAHQANQMGCNINYPITAHEFLRGRYYHSGMKKFFIDNADMILQMVTNVPIEAITLTNNEEDS